MVDARRFESFILNYGGGLVLNRGLHAFGVFVYIANLGMLRGAEAANFCLRNRFLSLYKVWSILPILKDDYFAVINITIWLRWINFWTNLLLEHR